MNKLYISVASNISPEKNIQQAVARLRQFCKLISISRCFVTEAIAGPEGDLSVDIPYYINCVVLIETSNDVATFKRNILVPIEDALGRLRTSNKYESRTIDLDILLCDDQIIDQGGINIPDPDLLKRWFLLQGILDIDPAAVLPTTLLPLSRYLEDLNAQAATSVSRQMNVDDRLRACLMAEIFGLAWREYDSVGSGISFSQA